MKSTRFIRQALCLLAPALLGITAVQAQTANRLAKAVQQEQLLYSAASYTLFEPLPERDALIDQEISNVVYLKLNKQLLQSLRSTRGQLVSFSLPVAGGSKHFTLSHYNILDEGFKVYERDGKGNKKEVKMDIGAFYRGIVSDAPNSLAAFNFADGEVAAVFSGPDGNYNLVLNYHDPGADRDHYVLFKEADVKSPKPAGCAVTDAMGLAEQEAGTAAKGTYANCHKLRVSMQADYRLYLLRGNSVTSSANYLASLFNVMSALYANEGILAVMSEAVVNSEPDNYTYGSSSEVLYKFSSVLRSGFNGDIAQLISGYKQGGFPPLGGLAWLNVVCQKPAQRGAGVWFGPFSMCDNYVLDNIPQLPMYSWDVSASSHEIGHNIGSPHTQSCHWPGGPIDNCVAVEDGDCDPGPAPDPSGGTVMSYCHLTSVGINLSLGFGPLPGKLIRQNIADRTCLKNYQPAATLTAAQTVRIANRQCTDGEWTSYFYDNNTAIESDDELLLMIRTNGQDIGNVDVSGFEVSMTTTPAYGSNTGRSITAPYAGSDWKEANRSWNINTPLPVKTGTVIGVRFPFAPQDVLDIKGSLPALSQASQLSVVAFNNKGAAMAPNTAPATAVNYYTNAASADTRHWKLVNAGNYYYAEFESSYGIFGGSIGFANTPLQSSLEVYPNPATDWLKINAPVGSLSSGYAVAVSDQLGRIVLREEFDAATGGNVQLDVAPLSRGVYNIRFVSDGFTFNTRFVKR